uniref:Uncharacterized protein n=1 Tax=Candidatus Kentrum sp. FW TaxID=2126338 RepID=A0A450T7X8_9GAMM|nr:MAG: hypothetical protein BECKFW1821C_GA0114237_100346 [Candidatus Kentron sp. FW]
MNTTQKPIGFVAPTIPPKELCLHMRRLEKALNTTREALYTASESFKVASDEYNYIVHGVEVKPGSKRR